MKGSCTLVASMIAASTVALSSSSSTSPPSAAGDREIAFNSSVVNRGSGVSTGGSESLNCGGCPAQEQEQEEEQGKFVPRFDGLRFIETLVTAHR